VRSTELTEQQIADLLRVLGPTLGYLSRMVRRMDKLAFPHDDMQYRQAVDAQHRMQGLCMELHYLSCRSGVGWAPREKPVAESPFD